MPDENGNLNRLLHIRDSILRLELYCTDINFSQFESDTLIQDGCIRQLEVIGEACSRIDSELKIQYSAIEWRLLISEIYLFISILVLISKLYGILSIRMCQN